MSTEDVTRYFILPLLDNFEIKGDDDTKARRTEMVRQKLAHYSVKMLQMAAGVIVNNRSWKTFPPISDILKVFAEIAPSEPDDNRAWILAQEQAHGKVFVERNSPEWKALQSSKHRKPGNYFMSKAHGCEGWHWPIEQLDEIRTREFYNG